MIEKIKHSKLNGVIEMFPKVFNDERGSFVKTFHNEVFSRHEMETKFKEQYYSISEKNVIRGLHFQVPPEDHSKLVYCPLGKVIDIVVDLRKGSPTYGEFDTFTLSSDQKNSIYIPKGFAHGFGTLSDKAILVYNVSTVYSPSCDSGILWSSLDIQWKIENPIVSKRDNEFISMKDFQSPFIFKEVY